MLPSYKNIRANGSHHKVYIHGLRISGSFSSHESSAELVGIQLYTQPSEKNLMLYTHRRCDVLCSSIQSWSRI